MMKTSPHIALIDGWNPAAAWIVALCLAIGGMLLAPVKAAAAPAPEISLSLRGVADQAVDVGEPLRIVVRVRAPRAAKDAIKLAPATGTWADAVRVEIVPASGGAAVAQAEAVGKPDTPSATLDQKQIAGGLWRISSEAMQRVAPGNYVVRSRLVIPGGSGWTGEVISSPLPLQVIAASNAAGRVVQRTINRAQDALLGGRVEEAAGMLDAVLANSPNDVRLLTTRAVVAERAGNIVAALLCANRADRARSVTGKGQPSAELEELLGRLRQALPEAMKRPDKPAEWTWPPANVMAISDPMLPANAKAGSAAAPATSIPVAPKAISPPATAAPVAPTSPAPGPKAATAAIGAPADGKIVPPFELTDAKIAAEPTGQWAATAKAGSQYSNPTYSAERAAGAPDVPVTGDSPQAWCPAAKSGGNDWLEVSFAQPVNATEVRVRQSNCPGAIIKIEAFEADGTAHVWWEGADTYQPSAIREVVWFAVRVPKTPYLVAKVKITLNLSAVPGWKQIDAVQLVGATE